ncbi:MAG: outer membrane protein assembly factor BamA [Deltaproteobacteria bacterium]|nr:outer membrane protein assembly factor BamA [Deltaproteobacteria bacterium]
MKHSLFIVFAFCLISMLISKSGALLAEDQLIHDIKITGNGRVESPAIRKLLKTSTGQSPDAEIIREDLEALYDLGYFSDIRIYQDQTEQGLILTIEVLEKPAITKIIFQGMDELKEDDIRKSMETSLYTILNEGVITADMRLIEKKYAEKGFNLAKITYSLENKGKNEVELTFHVNEGGKVLVGDVFILGNQYFSEGDLIDKMASRPFTRWSATLGAPSMYQEDYVKRDLEFLTFYYKDYGFAEVNVRQPVVLMDPDKRFVRITFEIEEGLQYRLGSLSVTGDVGEGLYTPEELIRDMQLKPSELFRHSKFTKDIEHLIDRYGDLGYAYVDINPIVEYDKKKQLVHLNYEITKGEKVYFGRMDIIGNTKTRDNVIRREFEVYDSELYSGTRLSETKKNINRLGFFEEVQVLKERDEEAEHLLNLKVRVKEKATGQLNAAVGFTPAGEQKSKWSGQGSYNEKNQSGRAWNAGVTGKYSGKKSWELDLNFLDPRVRDSEWSLGFGLGYKIQEIRYLTGMEIPVNDQSVSARVGRSLFELVRAFSVLKHTESYELEKRQDIYIKESQKAVGVKNSLTLGIIRKDLDNFLDPTEGTSLNISHSFVGGALGGHYRYGESTAESDYYIPLDFADSYRTYFKLTAVIGKLWPAGGDKIPPAEMYRLGYYDLRGYPYSGVGEKTRRLRGPDSSSIEYNIGGDKKLYFQLEYFVPLIPQAGIKALVFADIGDVFTAEENYNLNFRTLKKDVGFGFRWHTPIAPFRFEWAYPYDDEKKEFGNMQFIFNLGF